MMRDDDKAVMLDAIAAYVHASPFDGLVGAFVMDLLDESPYGLPESARKYREAARRRAEANDRAWRAVARPTIVE